MYTVGRLAKRFGLSRSTLLYYDKIGLLCPSGHTPGEYRRYSEYDARRLQRICMFRDAGLSLSDISRALSATNTTPPTGDSHSLAAILEARLVELHHEIALLRNQQTIITGLLGLDTPDTHTPVTKELWTALLAKAGFTENDMLRWHAQFEHTAPEKHAQFLQLLGIAESEIAVIRSRAAASLH